jgi:hypothetical protein
VEAARIVARAIERIRRDEPDGLNMRRDLEPVLNRLIEEFKVELAALGVQVPDGAKPPGTFSFTPVDRVQGFGGYANHAVQRVSVTVREADPSDAPTREDRTTNPDDGGAEGPTEQS